jgi:ureidoacrylate peracid hydrolase
MSKSLLLVIDFINEIVNPKAKTGVCAAHVAEKKVIDKANQAIAWARGKKMPIAHVKVGFSDDYIECPKKSPVFSKAAENGVLKLGEWGTEFHDDMDVRPEDKVIIKHRISAFYNTDLETVLRANGVETLYICGVSTNMAVELTSREAHDRDYQVVVIGDACGSSDEEMHQMALKVLTRIAKIVLVSELG